MSARSELSQRCPCPTECGHHVQPADERRHKRLKTHTRNNGKDRAVFDCVSLPRPVYPGSLCLITRRCTHRQFLLRPDPETVNAFIYCLAIAAHRHEIDILDVIQMSNHLHDVIFDRHGNAPAFYADFHRLLAKCVNVIRCRWENFFSSEQTSVVRIETTVDLIDRLVYVATNPIKAGLVARVDDWPGVSGFRSLLSGKPLHATRPKYFFSEDGVMPDEVTLYMTWPAELSDRDEVLAEVEARVAQVERDKAAELKRVGRRVLGRRAVIHQSWSGAPTTYEPRRQTQRTIAARCKWTLFEALQRKRDFIAGYRKARSALLSGIPIPFPHGTYWLRRFAGVEVGLSQILN